MDLPQPVETDYPDSPCETVGARELASTRW